MKTITLQSLGTFQADFFSDVQVGDELVWNWGMKTTVVEITRESEKSVWIVERCNESGKDLPVRRLKTTTCYILRNGKRLNEQPEESSHSEEFVVCYAPKNATHGNVVFDYGYAYGSDIKEAMKRDTKEAAQNRADKLNELRGDIKLETMEVKQVSELVKVEVSGDWGSDYVYRLKENISKPTIDVVAVSKAVADWAIDIIALANAGVPTDEAEKEAAEKLHNKIGDTIHYLSKDQKTEIEKIIRAEFMFDHKPQEAGIKVQSEHGVEFWVGIKNYTTLDRLQDMFLAYTAAVDYIANSNKKREGVLMLDQSGFVGSLVDYYDNKEVTV